MVVMMKSFHTESAATWLVNVKRLISAFAAGCSVDSS